MASKYTSILLLVSVVLLLAQAKHVQRDSQFVWRTFPKRYNQVTYKGRTSSCNGIVRVKVDRETGWFEQSSACNCLFVACTGSQECTTRSGWFCRFLHHNVDVHNMERDDCGCKYLK
ncbi:uncharacterized protein LOC144645490 [Oculina patagonica]